MPPASRFGASKYRNAVPHIPGKDEWYRANLPPATSSTSATSTFSSEVKTNHLGIFTLTPNGEFTFRPYESTSADGVKVKRGLTGTVGDWDVSKVEGGGVVVGGTDGTIFLYSFSQDQSDTLELVHTIPGSSPIALLALHPTTPNILLASSVAAPLRIYDLSSSPDVPKVTLDCSEPKGLWTAAWSANGRRIAAVGKSGQAYIFDPRSSTEPLTTRALPLQPLKPCRIVWVGDNVLVTSTSKTRNREYSLFSGQDLKTIFTQTLDTSPGLLNPHVDEERKLIYISGKGDSTLRQVELSGPQGYQETLHSLPTPLPSGSFALAHPTTLPVMQAQIATVLIPTSDKDGDALVPFGIRVPRRFLIDFHEDLFPDITGVVPEQTATEWFKGEDRLPLPISLDPSRRVEWEKQLSSLSGSKKGPSAPKTSSETLSKPAEDPSPKTSKDHSTAAAASAAPAAAPPSNSDLPPLEGDETYASTSYKARLIGRHIGQQVEKHRKSGKMGPLMVGLQGPQGCGKTTLCEAFLDLLTQPPYNLKLAVLSLDDLYRNHDGLKDIASKHPENALLQGRGPPGTHDVELAVDIIAQIQTINDGPGTKVQLPTFDKSLCGGEGDRSKETTTVTGPLDVFILEGWSMGFYPLPTKTLEERYSARTSLTDTSYFTSQPLSSLNVLNDYLAEFSSRVYPPFQTIIQVEPRSYEFVFSWRLEQEQNMKASNGGKGMDDSAVRNFVERYMPGYELWKDGIKSEDSPWAGNGIVLTFDQKRAVVGVEQLRASSTPVESPTSAPKGDDQPKTTGTPQRAQAASQPTASETPAKPANPNWSRKFLSGKSPLIPTYDQVPALSTLHQDSLILRCPSHLALFPIAGSGGRLAVHPLSKTGRMDKEEVSYLSGGVDIADFAVDDFLRDETSVAIAGEDGTVRVWRIPQKGLQDSGKAADMVLKGNENKITQVSFHPTAKDLLSAISADTLHLFDVSSGDLAQTVPIDSKGGAYNLTWSPQGDRLALALKDHRLAVLDPRDSSTIVYGQAHDSPRSFQIAWVDNTHLLSVGFARGSSRKINLYEILENEIKTISSLLIDTSPSVLFPTYDPDTRVLYIWGKGERQIQAFEVDPRNKTEPIAKLPSFTASAPQLGVAFLPKRMVDVKKVEIAKALRLTAKSIEDVSFSIPRNKPEFFQDDIFVDTIDTESPLLSTEEWLKGGKAEARYISLKPEGMTALSQAPQTPAKTRTKFVPAKDIMTEAQKKQQAMDNLFAKAKLDESSDEEVKPKGGLDPPDDDW